MDPEEEDFGWQKDTDFNGKEFYHPDLEVVAGFMEIICNGQTPELNWKSPGKRTGANICVPTSASTNKSSDSDSASRLFLTPARATSVASSLSMSPFDFDDSEQKSYTPSFPNVGSPLKMEPRKRLVGTLTNALQSIQVEKKIKVESPPRPSAAPSTPPKPETTTSLIVASDSATANGIPASFFIPAPPILAATVENVPETTEKSEAAADTGSAT
ncbi:hypothetical protein BV898_01054 [Hypsibius exemplaris]|uniref:Uncharacterized protein n=1 Tax=Hypsibius exemplaris TaxID=2072580 RepID=A0A1W0XD15_HYPEX|nr:hypothetical protein BV898_01054 [Hypsibius exemplaris]